MRVDLFERPLLIVPAIPKYGGINFILPKCSFMLDADTAPKAWEILELCDGINTIDMISNQLKDLDPSFIRGFLNDLRSQSIVVDSRRLYEVFHSLSNYPTPYYSDISEDKIIEHSNSARLPVKDGELFSFCQNKNSNILKLQELRKSCRSYSTERVGLDEIGGVLDVGYSFKRHAVPSAGGLYPMKIFVVALEDQKDFPAGYYEYDNEKDFLVLFNKEPDRQKIFYALNDIGMPFGAPLVILIAADISRQPYKYSNKGYRFMAIEAGEIAQNISLAAIELGLATCQLGGIHEDVFSEELELESCIPFLAIAIGKASDVENERIWRKSDDIERVYVGSDNPVNSCWLLDGSMEDNYHKSFFQFLAKSKNNQIASGISTSSFDAKLKAIAEAYERQRSSCVRWDIKSQAIALTEAWLDPRVFSPLDDSQYENLEHLQKFNERLEIEWIRGTGFDGRTVFVPIDLVFYPINEIGRKLVVDTCSSGFASFTDYGGAVERGLLELIERDCLMRNWYTKSSPNILDSSVLPVHLRNRIDFWSGLGREVIVLDISRSGAIVIEVIIKSNEYPCFVSGAACSLGDFADTSIKAFWEAESRLIYGLNEGCSRGIEPNEVRDVLDHELLYTQSTKYHDQIRYLWEGRVVQDIPNTSTAIEDLKRMFEIVVVDVSETNSLLKVVKVLSDKLIPISFGYGTGHYMHNSLDEFKKESQDYPHYFA